MKHIRILALLIIPMMFLSCSRDKNNPGYDYMGEHDMYYTKYYKAYTSNPIFSDSMTNQLPAEGAISRGNMPFPYPGGNIGEKAQNQAKAGLEFTNPIAANEVVLVIKALDEMAQSFGRIGCKMKDKVKTHVVE